MVSPKAPDPEDLALMQFARCTSPLARPFGGEERGRPTGRPRVRGGHLSDPNRPAPSLDCCSHQQAVPLTLTLSPESREEMERPVTTRGQRTRKMPDKKLILLGHIAGAHGIRGEVLVKTYTVAPEDIAAYGPLTDASGTNPTS